MDSIIELAEKVTESIKQDFLEVVDLPSDDLDYDQAMIMCMGILVSFISRLDSIDLRMETAERVIGITTLLLQADEARIGLTEEADEQTLH